MAWSFHRPFSSSPHLATDSVALTLYSSLTAGLAQKLKCHYDYYGNQEVPIQGVPDLALSKDVGPARKLHALTTLADHGLSGHTQHLLTSYCDRLRRTFNA
eukprot:4470817-Amphidinium_carterae.1